MFLCHIFTQRPRTDWKIEWSNGCYFGRQQLLSNSIKNLISHGKSDLLWLKIYTSLNLLTLELSQYHKSAFFLKHASLCQKPLQLTWTHPVFVLVSQTNPSCTWALPQELRPWFCSQCLQLSSGIAFVSDCQMTCRRGSNSDSNLNSAADQLAVKVFSAQKTQNNLCGV